MKQICEAQEIVEANAIKQGAYALQKWAWQAALCVCVCAKLLNDVTLIEMEASSGQLSHYIKKQYTHTYTWR